MLDILIQIFFYTGAVIAIVGILLLGFICWVMINEESKALFKHRRNDRFANKLFDKIEEYRNDFA